MRPVIGETVAPCAICGEVACERDLLEVESDDMIPGTRTGDLVCRDCGDGEGVIS